MPCSFCHDDGFYRDPLSLGESYCTCPAGDSLRKSDSKKTEDRRTRWDRIAENLALDGQSSFDD